MLSGSYSLHLEKADRNANLLKGRPFPNDFEQKNFYWLTLTVKSIVLLLKFIKVNMLRLDFVSMKSQYESYSSQC